MSRVRSAFTLIEMMVVLAITAVLLGIILIPMVQSFNFTRAAEGLADEQERGRLLIDQISRDIASGIAVRDNQGSSGETVISVPKYPYDGGFVELPLYNSRIDVVQPSLASSPEDHAYASKDSSGVWHIAYKDPSTGRLDPTLQSPVDQPVAPAAAGLTYVRYWVGLREPLAGDGTSPGEYNNPYDGALMPPNGNADNLYVLYRSVYQPYMLEVDPSSTASNPKFITVPNTVLFKIDPNDATKPYIDDPYFAIQSSNDPYKGANGGLIGQAARIKAWLGEPGTSGAATTTIVTEEHRFDMIMPVLNKSAGTDKIISLIQFRPSPVSQEPPAGEVSMSLGNETTVQSKSFLASDGNYYVNPDLGLASDVFRTTMGAWNAAVVSASPYPPLNTSAPYAPSIALGSTDYETLDTRSSAVNFPNITPTKSEQNIIMLNGVANSSSIPAGEALFDLTAYANASALSGVGNMYPFSFAISQAESEDTAAGATDWLTLSQSIRDEFIPFEYDEHGGQIETGFNIGEVGNPKDTAANEDNDPQVTTSGAAAIAYTPSNDPGLANTTKFYDPSFDSINEFFNASWSYAGNDPDGIGLTSSLRSLLQRFVDLRLEPEADGWASPMDPDPNDAAPLAYVLNNDTTSINLQTAKTPWASSWVGFDNVTIIPGSDQVVGPDQTSSLANPPSVLYTRVTSNPGPNQYTINYTNIAEPRDYTAIIPDLSASAYPTTTASDGSTGVGPQGQTWNPTTQQWSGAYNPHDFLAAVIQPRYKVGYIGFDSDPNLPMPAGPVHISYRFQFNRPADQFSVNYDSREVINVLLTMRSYPQTTNMPNPQTITLQASAPVKNYIR